MDERARALAVSERLNASIIESLQEGLIVIDLGGRITRANQAAAELCGVSLGELVGSRLRDLPIEVTGRDGRPYGALSTCADVTGRVERERRIQAEADTDDLTGLANRRALGRMLEAALARARAHRLVVGVLMLELDGIDASLRAAGGVACHPDDGDDLDTLPAAADRAMYARKAAS